MCMNESGNHSFLRLVQGWRSHDEPSVVQHASNMKRAEDFGHQFARIRKMVATEELEISHRSIQCYGVLHTVTNSSI